MTPAVKVLARQPSQVHGIQVKNGQSAAPGRPMVAPDHAASPFISGLVCEFQHPPAHVQAFRFQVYCGECGFLDAADFPDGLERDAYDASSAHFVAASGGVSPAAYARLVLSSRCAELPMVAHGLRPEYEGIVQPAKNESAEISRLIVDAQYRRRRSDHPVGLPWELDPAPLRAERRSDSSQLLLTLYRQMYTYSVDHGIRYWYAAMERCLARSLRSMGFDFRQVGPVKDYAGPVAPFVADLRELEQALSDRNPELLTWLQRRDLALA